MKLQSKKGCSNIINLPKRFFNFPSVLHGLNGMGDNWRPRRTVNTILTTGHEKCLAKSLHSRLGTKVRSFVLVENVIGLPISFGRPMVFDSLFQKMSQNLPVYLQMYPPPGMKKLDIRST